jgi:hypothetical protein
MPVFKYRSVAEMPPPPVSTADLTVRIRTAWRRAFLLCPPAIPRGVQRFRTPEESNEARLELLSERMRRTVKDPA